jgi:hypothetical protein
VVDYFCFNFIFSSLSPDRMLSQIRGNSNEEKTNNCVCISQCWQALSSGGAFLSFIFAKLNCIFYMHVKHIYTDRLIGLLDYIKVLQDWLMVLNAITYWGVILLSVLVTYPKPFKSNGNKRWQGVITLSVMRFNIMGFSIMTLCLVAGCH